MPSKKNPGKKQPKKSEKGSGKGVTRTVVTQAMDMDPLKQVEQKVFTPKELIFIYEYCSNGFNGTIAAKEAGYKCEKENTYASIASENLRKPHIKTEIDRILSENIMPRLEVIKRIGDIARGSLNDYLVIKQELQRPTIKAHLSVLIAELKAKIEDQEKFIIRSGNMTDQRRGIFESNIEAWLDEILRCEIELERNPAAYREVEGPEVIVETVELDLVKLARDKERGIVKKFSKGRKGWEVELYDASASLRDLGRHWGIFEEDNKQKPKPTVNVENLNTQELNILLAIKRKAAINGTNG
jgi:phage terminase small subunit